MMILLSQTNFPLESGLQSIFQENNVETTPTNFILKEFHKIIKKLEETFENENATLAFFIFSVVWSFKSCAVTSVKIKHESKGFLPFFPALLLLTRYLLIFLVRITFIVIYFSPFIGLLDIMAHYQAETIPLHFDLFNSTKDFHYWNPDEEDFQSVPMEQLFRSNYSDTLYPQPPSTKIYTLISLGHATLS